MTPSPTYVSRTTEAVEALDLQVEQRLADLTPLEQMEVAMELLRRLTEIVSGIVEDMQ
jgi:hypothetical protein